jgi:hypothetical protein
MAIGITLPGWRKSGGASALPKYLMFSRQTVRFCGRNRGRAGADQRIPKRASSSTITKQPIDTGTAAGKCFLDMLGVFAAFETNLRRERQLEGDREAKAAGVNNGRPATNSARRTSLRPSRSGGRPFIAYWRPADSRASPRASCAPDGGSAIETSPAAAGHADRRLKLTDAVEKVVVHR